jgi:hypothetical protein
LRVVLGLFLLGAAGLKIHGLFSGSSVRDSLLSSPRLQVATIEVELLLGAWLLSGWWLVGAWTAALGFFGIVAGVSLYLALVGQTSCGCFGAVAVNPWATLGIDVTATLALLLCRPPQSSGLLSPQSKAYSFKTALTVGAALVPMGGACLLWNDDLDAVLAQLRGEAVTVEPALTDVGKGKAGEKRTFSVQLSNRSAKTVRILGGTTSCSCIATNDLPITIAPGATETITVEVRFRGSPGRFQHRYYLYTDADGQRVVIARFTGRLMVRSE